MKKCPLCQKMVSEKEKNCPFCGTNMDTNVYCPKCKSPNTSLLYEHSGDMKTLAASMAFGSIIGGQMTKDKVKYICNDCGKKFKNK